MLQHGFSVARDPSFYQIDIDSLGLIFLLLEFSPLLFLDKGPLLETFKLGDFLLGVALSLLKVVLELAHLFLFL